MTEKAAPPLQSKALFPSSSNPMLPSQASTVSPWEINESSTHPKQSNGARSPSRGPQPIQRVVEPLVSLNQWKMEKRDVTTLEEEHERLVQERDELAADLENCKASLFAIRPPSQISDDSIQRGFKRIHAAIDRFVWDALSDARDDALYDNWRSRRHTSRRRKPGAAKIVTKAEMLAWRLFECSNFLILSVVIERILDKYIFQERYPFSISSKQMRFVREVENGMRCLGHAKGETSIDRWRSETLTALTFLPDSRRQRELNTRRIYKQASEVLSYWLLKNDGSLAEFQGRFQRDILDPAIEFLEDIRISSDQSRTEFPDLSAEYSPRQMLDKWDLIDADSWRPIKKEEHVGQTVHCLHPSFSRLRANGGASLVLVKPVVIVARLGEERRQSQHGAKAALTTTNRATSESDYADDWLVSTLARHDPEGTEDSDSDMTSSKTSDRSDESKLPTKVKQVQQVRSRPPQASHTWPAPSDHQGLVGNSRYNPVRETQLSERSGEVQRGRSQAYCDTIEEGKAKILPHRAMMEIPPERGSMDTAGEPVTRPRPLKYHRSLPTSPLNSMKNSPSAKSYFPPRRS